VNTDIIYLSSNQQPTTEELQILMHKFPLTTQQPTILLSGFCCPHTSSGTEGFIRERINQYSIQSFCVLTVGRGRTTCFQQRDQCYSSRSSCSLRLARSGLVVAGHGRWQHHMREPWLPATLCFLTVDPMVRPYSRFLNGLVEDHFERTTTAATRIRSTGAWIQHDGRPADT
jgi:hypothetical protein